MLSSEETMGISDVKQQIAHLYSTLNVEEHQLQRERELQARLEHYQLQLKPLEDVCCFSTFLAPLGPLLSVSVD